jgi:hypothetical protein
MAKAATAKREKAAIHAACANCGAALKGRWCHACGQDSHPHNRAIWPLIVEAVEGLFHLDGRLLSTLPDLFFRPGRLARDYLDGRLARHMPPFRTFLASLVIFIFAAEYAVHQNTVAHEREVAQREALLKTPQGRAKVAGDMRTEAAKDRDEDIKEAADERAEELKDPDMPRSGAEARYARHVGRAQARYTFAMANADRVAGGLPELAKPKSPPGAKQGWWQEGKRKAVENVEYFAAVFFAWGHRLAVLLLPVVALTLAAVYRNRREIYLYNHLLVAMNLMSFAFLTNAVTLVLPMPVAGWWMGLLALWTPVNLFQTLRGGYGSSVLGAVVKTLIVWFTSVTAFGLLLLGLVLFTLTQL